MKQDDAREYLVMRADSTYDYIHEGDETKLSGEWEVEGNAITWNLGDIMR